MQKSGFPKMRHYVGFSQIGSQMIFQFHTFSTAHLIQESQLRLHFKAHKNSHPPYVINWSPELGKLLFKSNILHITSYFIMDVV